MAASALWQPQEQGLREICAHLEAHISPNSDQARIWQQLQQYSQFPDFNNYLTFILARGEVSLPFLLVAPPPQSLAGFFRSPRRQQSLGFSPMVLEI